MISLPGSLTVKTITGRNGPFNVGSLSTGIGDFCVKDKLLEELSEGRYEGNFVVSRIAPAQPYQSRGRLVIEVRAFLDDYQLKDLQELPPDEVDENVQDPAEEENAEKVSRHGENSTDDNSVEADTSSGNEPEDQQTENHSADFITMLKELFKDTFFDCDDTLIQPSIVKLDPTVDRMLLRQQSTTLQNLGYENDYKARAWKLKNQEQFQKFVADRK